MKLRSGIVKSVTPQKRTQTRTMEAKIKRLRKMVACQYSVRKKLMKSTREYRQQSLIIKRFEDELQLLTTEASKKPGRKTKKKHKKTKHESEEFFLDFQGTSKPPLTDEPSFSGTPETTLKIEIPSGSKDVICDDDNTPIAFIDQYPTKNEVADVPEQTKNEPNENSTSDLPTIAAFSKSHVKLNVSVMQILSPITSAESVEDLTKIEDNKPTTTTINLIDSDDDVEIITLNDTDCIEVINLWDESEPIRTNTPKLPRLADVKKRKVRNGPSRWGPKSSKLRDRVQMKKNEQKKMSEEFSLRCQSMGNNNVYNDAPAPRRGLRLVVIDGSNVAIGHTNGKHFSVEGLKICIDFFKHRGHEVKVFVPQHRLTRDQSSNSHLLQQLRDQGTVVVTPARTVNGQLIASYDDRYILQCAAEFEGVVVSNDNFRDLIHEHPAWRDTIEKRLLMWTWVKDMIMFPKDPLGPNGPTLDEFLRF